MIEDFKTNKPLLIFIISTPRSLSTIFLRTFMNQPNVQVFHEKMSPIYYEEVLNKHRKVSLEDLTRDHEKLIEKALNENKTVIVKETTDVAPNFLEIIKKWNNKFNMKYVYLTRHPKPVHVSMQKMIDEENKIKRFPDDVMENLANMDLYTPLWDLYKIFGGKVIIAEDLQENPPKIFEEVFDYCNLKFKEEVLTYEPLSKIGIPEEMVYFEKWYSDCINATSMWPGMTDIKSIVIEDIKDVERIKIEEEIYNKFAEERKNQLNNR